MAPMDNHHVSISESHASCAILELSRMSNDHGKVLKALASRLYHPSRGVPAAMVLWSDTHCELANYIKRAFGDSTCMTVDPVENPKTGNEVYAFLWILPHEKFREWYKQFRIKSIQKE